MKFKYKKIKDIAVVYSGTTPSTSKSEYWNGNIKWITPAELQDGHNWYIYDTERKITDEAVRSKNLKMLKKGTILLTTRAPIGKVALVGEVMCTNQGFKNIECNTDVVNPEFLYFWLLSKKEYLNSLGRGATFKEISKTIVENIQVPVPPLGIQGKIVEILKQSLFLIDKRKAQIEVLDQLTQSVFLEMFGDPITNPKNWVKLTLPEFSSKDKYSIKRGPFGGALKKEIFVKEGYLVYEQYHAINDDFSMERYFIDEKKFEELKAFEVKPKDLIISCSGVTLGRIAEIPLNAPKGIINQALLKLTLDSNKMNNTFFKFLFRHPNIQDILFGFSRGSGIPNFPPMSEVKSIEFICPPIELQNDFEKKVNIILQKKTAFEKGLNKVEYFFSSIMQQSFKGELFTKEKVTSL